MQRLIVRLRGSHDYRKSSLNKVDGRIGASGIKSPTPMTGLATDSVSEKEVHT